MKYKTKATVTYQRYSTRRCLRCEKINVSKKAPCTCLRFRLKIARDLNASINLYSQKKLSPS
ncbi:MAG: zinc ribbon domain-containing protein [Thermoproteota archaeon]